MTNKPIGLLAALAMAALSQGCALLMSNPYYKPSTSAPAIGRADISGFAFVRLGGQNRLTVMGKDVDIGVKSIGSMHGYVPMAMGPILPVIPTFMTAPDKAHPIVFLEVYVDTHSDDVAFNPMVVRIQNHLGTQFTPESYAGPVTPESGAFPFYLAETVRTDNREITLTRDTSYCFVLKFDMKAEPDWNLGMHVDGLRMGDMKLVAPEFQLDRGTAVYIMWGGAAFFCTG